MAHWNVGIDETGRFNGFNSKDKSCAVAVVTKSSEVQLLAQFAKAYDKCGFGSPAPTGRKDVLAPFHWTALLPEQKLVCRDLFSPSIVAILKSNGKPPLISNQQHWWVLAIQTVITGFFSSGYAQSGDSVHIEIDVRKGTQLGLSQDSIDSLESNSEKDYWKSYHNLLVEKYKQLVEPFRKNGIEIKISFESDSYSPFVNLADCACGFLWSEFELTNPAHLTPKSFSCAALATGQSPVAMIKHNPLGALSLILSELQQGETGNLSLIDQIFASASHSDESYSFAWEEISAFFERMCESRGYNSEAMDQLSKLRQTVIKEFQNRGKEKLPVDQRLKLLQQFITLDTHKGISRSSYRDSFMELFKQGSGGVERLSARWEMYVKLLVSTVQLSCNGYRFSEVIDDLDPVWSIQERMKTIGFPFATSPDETTAEITGSLGQAYAFLGDFESAISLFDEDYMNAGESKSKPASYLGSVYHRMRDLDKCNEWFEKQSGHSAKEFGKSISQSTDGWLLASYFRLRGLELHSTGKTDLPMANRIDWNQGTGYPWPLVLKWAAFNIALESRTDEAIEWLEDASQQLNQNPKEFTIRTLSLPLYQMIAGLKQDSNLAQFYGNLVTELTCTESGFQQYVTEVEPRLQSLMDPAFDLWDRAMLLPFNYA